MELDRPFLTVTPTLDGDVLGILARAPETAFTSGDVRKILGKYSTEGVRKVLGRLTEQGVVSLDRAGSAFVYRFNSEHLAAAHIVGISRLFDELLRRLTEEFQSWRIPPYYAALFGSAADGRMTTDSDIDLFLVRPDDAADDVWDEQVSDLLTKVRKWTGNDARDLQYSRNEIDVLGPTEPVFRDILAEGLTVAGERSSFARMVRGRRRAGEQGDTDGANDRL